ncbi:MAG: hypothetical protein Q4A15_07040 [Prevotellaceae bacterium]|nr:hypothetical protein [Prevotellaceae bacterium]
MKKKYEMPSVLTMRLEASNILCGSKDPWEEIEIRNSKEDDSEFGDDEIYEWDDRI